MDKKDLEIRFTYHPPRSNQVERYEVLRVIAKTLALEILELVPDGREKSLAITHLEQAIMWANAGIARRE